MVCVFIIYCLQCFSVANLIDHPVFENIDWSKSRGRTQRKSAIKQENMSRKQPEYITCPEVSLAETKSKHSHTVGFSSSQHHLIFFVDEAGSEQKRKKASIASQLQQSRPTLWASEREKHVTILTKNELLQTQTLLVYQVSHWRVPCGMASVTVACKTVQTTRNWEQKCGHQIHQWKNRSWDPCGVCSPQQTFWGLWSYCLSI